MVSKKQMKQRATHSIEAADGLGDAKCAAYNRTEKDKEETGKDDVLWPQPRGTATRSSHPNRNKAGFLFDDLGFAAHALGMPDAAQQRSVVFLVDATHT